MTLWRIATVKSTGKKYVVQQLDFRTDRCHTWGEEFVSCYGKGYCWDEFMYEYCQLFEGPLPFDPDTLMAAIRTAEENA